VPPYLGPSDGDKKESRWQNHGKRKSLLTKMTTVQKVQESQKNQDNQKKAARKAQPRRASLKKVRPTATVAVKPSSASLPAQPEAAGAMPGLPARSAPGGGAYRRHYSPLIARAVEGLDTSTGEARWSVYERACIRWLSDEPDPRDLMRPFPAGPMRMGPISTGVNKPEHDDPSIVEPIAIATSAA
jgi:hypothetical protein